MEAIFVHHSHLDIPSILHHQRSLDLLLGGYKPEVQLTSNLNVRCWGEGLNKHNERRFVAENLNVVAVLLQLQRSEYDLDAAWVQLGGVCHAPCTHAQLHTLHESMVPSAGSSCQALAGTAQETPC